MFLLYAGVCVSVGVLPLHCKNSLFTFRPEEEERPCFDIAAEINGVTSENGTSGGGYTEGSSITAARKSVSKHVAAPYVSMIQTSRFQRLVQAREDLGILRYARHCVEFCVELYHLRHARDQQPKAFYENHCVSCRAFASGKIVKPLKATCFPGPGVI